MTYLKCPECGITLAASHSGGPKRCPRCRLRSGAVVQLIRAMRAPTPPARGGAARHA